MVNKLKKLPSEYRSFLNQASALAGSLDCRIYLVGGVVRDLLLKKGVFDLDVVVEGDAIDFVQALSDKLGLKFKKHHAFGTASVYFGKHKVDFATARKEYYTGWGVLPVVQPSNLKDDLFRRDFTINAMAISLNKGDYGRLVDYYEGLSDLKKGLIRVLHNNSFLDDPTRILRALRFQQRFSFRIEPVTAGFLKQALELDSISLVHPHRLRDELVLILKEPKPAKYIKQINKLIGFSFMSPKLTLQAGDYKLFSSIERSISFYVKKFKKHRKLDYWIIYLMGLMVKLPQKDIITFLKKFDFRKGERMRILSAKTYLRSVKKLDKSLKPHRVYCLLDAMSFESIIFFHAYYPQRAIRKNIELFLSKLVNTRLKVKGNDLKKLGFKPSNLYSDVLEKVLYSKIDKGLRSKQQEMEEVTRVFSRIFKSRQKRK